MLLDAPWGPGAGSLKELLQVAKQGLVVLMGYLHPSTFT